MQSPLQVDFHGLDPSPAVSYRIERGISHLEKLFPRIIDARVVVEKSHRHQRKGMPYRVRIELNVPGERLVVGREPGLDPAHADVYVAIRDAFAAMERILQDYSRKMRGKVKAHASPVAVGEIARLFPYEGYGFLLTDDQREVYFDANAVLNGNFDHLEVGVRVKFCEELGEKGPQASTVYA
ncbi:MAG: HPF/RaiA family ribosome-associated protein [Deltaproteobacteria bacterium]|nr:HPF/RaiA family ribosome-associated protein [Deltaproteobacteria bacterium]